MRDNVTVFEMIVGDIRAEIVSPFHPSALHAKAIEDAPLHFLPNIEMKTVFQNKLREVQAFAGIGEASSGIPMELQLAIWLELPQVRKAGGVIEKHAEGEFAPSVVAGKIGVL